MLLLHWLFFLDCFVLEGKSIMIGSNVRNRSPRNTASQPRTLESSSPPPWDFHILFVWSHLKPTITARQRGQKNSVQVLHINCNCLFYSTASNVFLSKDKRILEISKVHPHDGGIYICMGSNKASSKEKHFNLTVFGEYTLTGMRFMTQFMWNICRFTDPLIPLCSIRSLGIDSVFLFKINGIA